LLDASGRLVSGGETGHIGASLTSFHHGQTNRRSNTQIVTSRSYSYDLPNMIRPTSMVTTSHQTLSE